MKLKLILSSLVFLFLITYSCKKDPIELSPQQITELEWQIIERDLNLPRETMDYTLQFPYHYGGGTLSINNNFATLGRVIFYDKNLSKTRKISCASCHKQELAFSDDIALSKGVKGRKTERNSLALGAVFSFSEYYGSPSVGRIPFMWDNRAESVVEQSEMAFKNSREMDMKMQEVVDRMLDLPYYSPLIKKAFGEDVIFDKNKLLQALDTFVNTIGSVNSKFDQDLDAELHRSSSTGSTTTLEAILRKPFTEFTAQENQGKHMFFYHGCSHCHGNIIGPASRIAENIGLQMNYKDPGVGGLPTSYLPSDKDKFKVPTLRNIALTAPYMHDGRFSTLDQVLEHYSAGIADHENLSSLLKYNGHPKKFNFSEEEKEAFIAFFHTLTDESFITDERFSDPFK